MNKKLLEKARQGDVAAQTQIALEILKNDPKPDDFETAVKWLKPAAEAGEGEAQFTLGALYQQGNGVPMDMAQAA